MKIFFWVLGVLVALFAGACLGLYLYFTPERIVKIIEEKSSEFLDAELYVKKIDYTLFSSFPWLNFEIDSVSLVSKSLNELTPEEKSNLPQNAEDLAYISNIKGRVDIRKLLKGDIVINNLEISQPDLNLIAVNDSVANYYIFPKIKMPRKMPQFSLEKFNVVPPILICYESIPLSAKVNAEIDTLYIEHLDGLRYDFGLEGVVSGGYKDLELKASTPIAVHTIAGVYYPDFYLSLEDLNLKVENVEAKIKTQLEADTKNIKIEEFQANIKSDDLFRTIESLPEQIAEKIPMPKNLEGYLPFDLDIELQSKWQIEIDSLKSITLKEAPAFLAKISTSDANVSFTPPNSKRINAENVCLDALFNYNPELPEETSLEICDLRLKGEGLSLIGEAFFSNLLGDSQNLNGQFNYDYQMFGDLHGRIEFDGVADKLGKNGFRDINVKGDLATNSLKVPQSIVNMPLVVSNLNSDFDISLPCYPISNYHDTEIYLDIKAGNVKATPDSTSNLTFNNLLVKIDLTDTIPGGAEPDGNIILTLDNLTANSGNTNFEGKGLRLSAFGNLNPSPEPTPKSFSLPSSQNEEIIAERSPHTSFYLQSQGGGMFETLRNLISLKGNLSMSQCLLTIPSYLYPVSILGLDINTDLNRMDFTLSRCRIGDSGFSLTGTLNGVGDFMSSYNPVLLSADADISFGNVDINQLSWGYYGAQLKNGNDSALKMPEKLVLTVSDSTAVLIPRNIQANLRLRSESAEYMGYRFTPLSTDIILKDGVAELQQLTIGTPYCTAIVDWTYSTRDLSDIFMDIKADVRNFNLESFYNVFPQVTAKAKEIKDFTGLFDVSADGNFRMFPDMFMNSPSLNLKYTVDGRDLRFSRHGKIEHITHLLMIRGDEPIRLSNLQISGGYHDNIFQINPFNISFEDYEIGIAGITNIDGEMFYHISLDKSPFHVPFGISLKGGFKHPQLRLGGTHIDDEEGEKVAEEIDDNLDVNIMAWLKHGWEIFVKTAAKYEYEK